MAVININCQYGLSTVIKACNNHGTFGWCEWEGEKSKGGCGANHILSSHNSGCAFVGRVMVIVFYRCYCVAHYEWNGLVLVLY